MALVKKIKYQVRVTQLITVVMDESNTDMPETLKEVVQMDRDIRSDPISFADEREPWETIETEITDIEWVEG